MVVLVALSTMRSARDVPATARITGTVLDSLHNEPLAGARIVLSGSDRKALTDDEGHFSIDSLAAGTYDVFVQHALIDSLGLRVAARGIKVDETSPAEVLLAVPGITNVRKMLCGQDASGGGIITGRVVRAGTSDGIAAANVVLSWYSLGTDPKAMQFTPNAVQTITDDRGYYAFCALPEDFEAAVGASTETDSTAMVPVSLAWSSIRIVSQRLALGGEPAAVNGTVVDSAGKPISGANLDVPGAKTKATSRADGTFTLADVPAGTRIVRARKIGYSASMVPAEAGSSSDLVRIALGPALANLSPVIVRAMRNDVADRTGFSRRMKAGWGKYASGEQLVASKAQCVVDGLRHSLFFLYRGLGCSINVARNQTAWGRNVYGSCMSVFIDDVYERAEKMQGGSYIELGWLRPEEIVGVEFYSSGGAPGRYGTSTCKVMLIWTISYRGAHH